MKRSTRSPGTPASLSNSTNHKLNMYALAASAAGVGMLALTQSSEAKIVYTPTWVEIVPKAKIPLDLNHDGKTDFTLSNSLSAYAGWQDKLKVEPNSNNAVLGTGASAYALRSGVHVGPNGKFQLTHTLMATHYGRCQSECASQSNGRWVNVTRRYLGLKFSINGQTHFGWARLNVTITYRGVYAALTGYAYETVPNAPIVTGQTKGGQSKSPSSVSPLSFTAPAPPASLGLLAQGAPGLDVWRKRYAHQQ
jgi:hypothetical protein